MAEAQLIFGEVIYLDRRREGHGMIAAHSFEKQRVAHALVIGLILGVGLVVGSLILAAGGVISPGHKAQRQVAGAVNEDAAGDVPVNFSGALITGDAGDAPILHVAVVHISIQINSQVLFLAHTVVQHRIPNRKIIVWVYALVFQQDFLKNSGFFQIGFDMIGSCAACAYADLAAGIAAKHRAGVYQCGFNAQARASFSGADACHAASDNHHVKIRRLIFRTYRHNLHLIRYQLRC